MHVKQATIILRLRRRETRKGQRLRWQSLTYSVRQRDESYWQAGITRLI